MDRGPARTCTTSSPPAHLRRAAFSLSTATRIRTPSSSSSTSPLPTRVWRPFLSTASLTIGARNGFSSGREGRGSGEAHDRQGGERQVPALTHTPEYVHHLRYSKGSNNELQTQVEVGQRVELVSEEEAVGIIGDAEEIGRMLQGLVLSL